MKEAATNIGRPTIQNEAAYRDGDDRGTEVLEGESRVPNVNVISKLLRVSDHLGTTTIDDGGDPQRKAKAEEDYRQGGAERCATLARIALLGVGARLASVA
jgi:hypothetical protein